MITGVLLAIARISGETAPLLFTSLNNQFWSLDLNSPMASLPVVIFQFALSPYKEWQQLAWTGALIITFTVLALSILRARSLPRENSHECRFAPSSVPTVAHAAVDAATFEKKISISDLNFYYGTHQALKNINLPLYRARSWRSSGRRAAESRPCCASSTGCTTSIPPARRGRGPARRRGHPVAQAGSQPAARPHRHGVPEADAVSHVDLREHRVRHPAL